MFKLSKVLVVAALFATQTLAYAQEPAVPATVTHAAEQGDAKAQAQLGAMYLLGSGVEKNEQQAAEWFLKAARQGYADAEIIVAALYDSGVGVKNDMPQATHWYEQAAAHGHSTAQAILGKNAAAKGGVAFNYQAMRLSASKQIPREYAKRLLLTQ